jgi:hypothetical protein
MEWQSIVALVVAIPVILKQARTKRAAIKKRVIQEEEMPVQEIEYKLTLAEAIKRYPWNK